MSIPTISIGLPVYNGEKHLRRAVDSILNQGFEDFELIVVDNDSTDSTPEICREYAERDSRVRFERNATNIGAGPNHNRVFALAQGRYFRWAAHDVQCLPGALSCCHDVISKASSSTTLVYPQCEIIDETGEHTDLSMASIESTDPRPHRRLARVVHRVSWVTQLYGLMPVEVLRKTRLIDSFPSSDYVLLAELAMLGEIRQIDGFHHRRWLEPDRGAAAQNRKKGWAAWLDPKKKGKGDWISYHHRLALEYLRSAWRLPLRTRDRLQCLFTGPWMHYRRVLLRNTGPFRMWLRGLFRGPGLAKGL